ncbi:hypothetical protein AJ88_11335 [Mesorhizobium amorphae CCBAU 01583]|nr:hypothetical protein AJ88_11335 [Mesorhizobium amorphae CCBAU 01583]
MVREEAEKLGAVARVDAAGNLFLTLNGRNPALPAIVIGSHLDSVPHGGNFDGAAGVVAGLAVMAELVGQNMQPPRDLILLATRAEEAVWFPLSYPGSEAALGLLKPRALEARRPTAAGRWPSICGRKASILTRCGVASPASTPAASPPSSKSISSKGRAWWPPRCRSASSPELPAAFAMSMRGASALMAIPVPSRALPAMTACLALPIWSPGSKRSGTRSSATAMRPPSPSAGWNPIRASMAAAACSANSASRSMCEAPTPPCWNGSRRGCTRFSPKSAPGAASPSKPGRASRGIRRRCRRR